MLGEIRGQIDRLTGSLMQLGRELAEHGEDLGAIEQARLLVALAEMRERVEDLTDELIEEAEEVG